MATNTNAQERAHIVRNKVDKRTLRPQGRMKRQHCAVSNDTKGTCSSNKTRKNTHLLDQKTNNVGNKEEEVLPCKGGQDKGTRLVLVGEELADNTLERSMSHFGERQLQVTVKAA